MRMEVVLPAAGSPGPVSEYYHLIVCVLAIVTLSYYRYIATEDRCLLTVVAEAKRIENIYIYIHIPACQNGQPAV